MTRSYNRTPCQLRPIKMELDVSKYAEGSCFICFGETQVLCTATVEEKVPNWLKGSHSGWVTAEYGMLPRSTSLRMDREAKKGQTGRTHEIQRLIGRSLRAGIDLTCIENITLHIDCDVLQADGGTRTASITGGFMAMYLACQKLIQQEKIKSLPITHFISAISCGIVDGIPLLDLDFNEDSNAQTDSNFVFTDEGNLIEIQSTAEHGSFSKKSFQELLSLAETGTQELFLLQKQVLLKRSSLLS